MGLAEDLLQVAGRLANPAPTDPEQANLRRSVSTAYYAVFHLLAGEAAQLWSGGSQASRLRLERAFEHRTMKEVSQSFSRPQWTDWNSQQLDLPTELRNVASAFVALQDARHVADYDGAKLWTPLEAQSKVAQAQIAFQQWQSVRTGELAQDYLLSFLLGPKRR